MAAIVAMYLLASMQEAATGFMAKTRSQRPNKLVTALSCGLVSAVLFISFLPGSDKNLLHTEGRLHESGHLLTFGLLAWITALTFTSRKSRMTLVGCLVALGFQIEFMQHIFFRGQMEWKDVLVDASGVIVGTLLAIITLTAEPYSRRRRSDES